jgi:hypothetical protein
MRLVLLLLLTVSGSAAGQASPTQPMEPVRDNSFLIEEAFNQPAGVVQHIGTFTSPMKGAYTFAFTQEWPLGGVRHQGSYTIPMVRTGGFSGVGDVGLNYRYQLGGASEGPWFASPRLSVLLPTGSAERGMGAGGVTIETMLPVSYEHPALTLTGNVGLALTPSARVGGAESRDMTVRAGGSAIWMATRSLNFLLEALMDESTSRVGPALMSRAREYTVSPGVRWARDLASGMQIVPGLAVPMRVGAGPSDTQLFVYLSVEHSFKR